MEERKVTMDKIVNLCKNRGFVFPGSEIYDGFANTWDYGPLGVELENNIKKAWWTEFVQKDKDAYGVDASILMNPNVWVASGHAAGFSDPKMDCKSCKQRFRADNLIEDYSKGTLSAEAMTNAEMENYINEHKIKCPHCGNFDWTPIRQFKLMFETSRGTIEGDKDVVYLRPETAQGEYVNFLNVQRSTRAKVPFSIAQIGKAFRNEITPGNFLFRTIEFEQMELQKFCHEKDSMAIYEDRKQQALSFAKKVGLSEEHLRFHDHDKLAFYAKAACDLQYLFPIGWEELNGVHHRTDYDLSNHQKATGKSMMYLDPFTNEKFIPNIIEYSMGVGRCALAILCEAYDEETLPDGDVRVVMHFKPIIAPYKVAVLPLQKNLNEKALQVYSMLCEKYSTSYDEAGSIGKRYRRQDEIGTPFCVTIDFETLENDSVTIRDRDSMEQIRLPISELDNYIAKALK